MTYIQLAYSDLILPALLVVMDGALSLALRLKLAQAQAQAAATVAPTSPSSNAQQLANLIARDTGPAGPV